MQVGMHVGCVREAGAGERRVALTPNVAKAMAKLGLTVLVEPGAGAQAGFPDEAYRAEGAEIAADRGDVFARAAVVAQVRTAIADATPGDLRRLRSGQIVLGICDALTADRESIERFAGTGASLLAMELMPRITRAQSMDVLSSQATVAGYKAVIVAAGELGTMFPLLMTAAGTVAAAKVFVIGAGVAGLQAIATAKRLGAVVSAYDVRPAVRDQVASVGGRFVEMSLDTGAAEDEGGYAKALGESFYQAQRAFLADAIAGHDVVISTAAVPGARSPLLITAEAVRRMQPGGVIVDLAAERGGNCELTRADERVEAHGVTILGPTNLPATVPHDASLMYARNVLALIQHLVGKEKASAERPIRLEPREGARDEIVEGTLIAHRGAVVHPRLLADAESHAAA